MIDGELLQAAFTGLITDGAVERVVDEEKLHYPVATLLDQIPAGTDAHVFGHRVGTGDYRARHPVYFLVAVFPVAGVLSRQGPWGHAHLDKAHAAIPRGGEFGVIAVMRHILLSDLTRLDHASAPGHLNPAPIHLDVHEAFLGSEVLGELVSGRRCGICHKSASSEVSLGVACDYGGHKRKGQVHFVKFFTSGKKRVIRGEAGELGGKSGPGRLRRAPECGEVRGQSPRRMGARCG